MGKHKKYERRTKVGTAIGKRIPSPSNKNPKVQAIGRHYKGKTAFAGNIGVGVAFGTGAGYAIGKKLGKR